MSILYWLSILFINFLAIIAAGSLGFLLSVMIFKFMDREEILTSVSDGLKTFLLTAIIGVLLFFPIKFVIEKALTFLFFKYIDSIY